MPAADIETVARSRFCRSVQSTQPLGLSVILRSRGPCICRMLEYDRCPATYCSFAPSLTVMATIPRVFTAAGVAGVLGALWIATPMQGLADTPVPVTCPSIPASPQGIAAPAPDVSTACPTTFTNAGAPGPQSASGGSAAPRTQTASSSGGSARPIGNAVGTASASKATASVATVLALNDSRLVLSALGSTPRAATFSFRPPTARSWALLANTIGAGSVLILMLAMLSAVMRSYGFQRFMAHRRMYG